MSLNEMNEEEEEEVVVSRPAMKQVAVAQGEDTAVVATADPVVNLEKIGSDGGGFEVLQRVTLPSNNRIALRMVLFDIGFM